jgi:hypothetical protein
MSRWFRFYDDAVNDPKVQRLEPKLFKAWVNLLCLASKNNGWLPAIEDVSFSLRVSEAEAGRIVDGLISSELIDDIDGRFCPHNWDARQFKSDVSNERVKRHRQRKCNVTAAVTVTPPETEQIQNTEQKDSEANASGAEAPIDHRQRLFRDGLQTLAKLTGKGPDACRSFVGKCLSAANDDAIVVLGLIEDAERNQVANASAWIAARLKPTEFANGRDAKAGNIIAASDKLVSIIDSFDAGPRETDQLRGPAGASNVRLLSQGGR